MLTRNEFAVLHSCYKGKNATQRQISEESELSLGTINAVLKSLTEEGLVDESSNITEAGVSALAPYRVDNALIMAAGLSSRFAPISYERPKGVLTVRGEVLIERQIRQLQEAGIRDIILVVGYKKEFFFYLADEYGVKIVVNEEYANRNNNSTIKVAAKYLGNTYICSSDDYFMENPFDLYVYEPYYAAAFAQGKTDEYCLSVKGKEKLITAVTVGGADAWVMLGHAYWDRGYSRRFLDILDDEYDKPGTAAKLWEDIYREHIGTLPMVMRPYADGQIWEFDSLEDLRQFDPHFIENIDSDILNNICRVLGCRKTDIGGIVPIKQGMTNLSFRFDAGEETYVYRHPGPGTENIINRHSETFSQNVASSLGIDRSFIYEDPDKGWKISRFLHVTEPFDYHNRDHVVQAMSMIRTLHRSGAESEYPLDMHEDTKKQMALLRLTDREVFRDFDELYSQAERFNELVKADGLPPVLCHNDFYDDNLLISDNGMDLIDWEYSGMSDYASDIAVFICCSDYTYEESLEVLRIYFERELTEAELLHNVAYLCVVSFHWLVWALHQEMVGSPVGEYLYMYYRFTKLFGAEAQKLLDARQP